MISSRKRNSTPWSPAANFWSTRGVFGKTFLRHARKWLEESRKTGLDLVLEIDVQGAAQVKEKLPESVAIFILLAIARGSWSAGLRSRGQDSDEEIARRLAKSHDEIAARSSSTTIFA